MTTQRVAVKKSVAAEAKKAKSEAKTRTKFAPSAIINHVPGKEAAYKGKRLAKFKLMRNGTTVAAFLTAMEKAKFGRSCGPLSRAVAQGLIRIISGK